MKKAITVHETALIQEFLVEHLKLFEGPEARYVASAKIMEYYDVV